MDTQLYIISQLALLSGGIVETETQILNKEDLELYVKQWVIK